MQIELQPVIQDDRISYQRPAQDGYTSNTPRSYGGGARLVIITLPRVKWLERPDVDVDIPEQRN